MQEPHQPTQAEILIKHFGQDWFIDVCKIVDETPDKVELKRKLGDYISDNFLSQAHTQWIEDVRLEIASYSQLPAEQTKYLLSLPQLQKTEDK